LGWSRLFFPFFFFLGSWRVDSSGRNKFCWQCFKLRLTTVTDRSATLPCTADT
jgi:hypothetical protein